MTTTSQSRKSRASSVASSCRCFKACLCLILSSNLSVWIVEVALASQAGVFVNWRSIPNVGGPYEHLFRPQNTGQEGKFLQTVEFRSGLATLKTIVKQAEDDERRIRVYGSKWSSTNIAYTDEYMVESWGLNYAQVGISDPNHLVSGYQGISDRLAFVQAGVMIKYLNQALLEAGLALSTTGASDGQRIVGATAANAHGGAFTFGAMPEWVRGIHIILPSKNVFLQRSSDEVVTPSFVQWLDDSGEGELMTDDDMFNSALVGLGGFGVVHGLLIEAEPLYELKCQVYQRSYPEMDDAVTSLNFAGLDLEGFDQESPYHFDVNLNPYKLGRSQNGAFIDYCEKVNISPVSQANTADQAGAPTSVLMGIDLYKSLSRLTPNQLLNVVPDGFFGLGTKLKRRIVGTVQQIGRQTSFSPFNSPVSQFPSLWFTSPDSDDPSSSENPLINLSVGVPLDRTLDAVEVIRRVLYDNPIFTIFGMRPVKSSQATMAFTRFVPVTMTIALSTDFSDLSLQVYGKIYDAMSRSGIPYTYHWGKGLPLNDKWIPSSYGAALADWQEQRNKLLDTELLRFIFSSEWMEQLGLYDPI